MNKEMWDKSVEFHGHACPGLAIGYRVAMEVVKLFEISSSSDEELVCVTENDACCVDAIQRILSCTIGKGNLIYRGTGKMAFSFFDRKTGRKVRFYLKPASKDMSREERQEFILKAPFEDIFVTGEPSFDVPEKARLFSTIKCEICGEGAPEHKVRFMDGKKVCLDCFKEYKRGW